MRLTRTWAIIGATLLAGIWPGAAVAQQPYKSWGGVPLETRVQNWAVPALQSWQASKGRFELTQNTRIVIPANSPADIRGLAEDFAQDLNARSGLTAAVSTDAPAAGAIVLTLGTPAGASTSPEAYDITIGDRIVVRARTRAGLFYGTQSLIQMLGYDTAGRSLPRGVVQDWPNYPQRAIMIDVGRRYYEIATLERLMRQMASLKLNTLSLHFTDWPAFRLNSPKFPGLADRQSYDRADVQRLEATARRYGITIIPEIDLPAHAVAMTQYKPSLAFRCESMRQSGWLTKAAGDDAKGKAWTIDITRRENRQWIQSVLAEFIPWFEGPYFHIGGDEYQYDADKTRCPELMAYTKQRGFEFPGDVFIDWINETNGFVRKFGKQTVMWSWWRFRDDKTSLQPDKNILIYSWNAPRQEEIIADGYQVMVTPEDTLYVSPGLEGPGPSGYGVFNNDTVYNLPLAKGSNVTGYMVALWADAAEHRSDGFFMGKLHEPMAVLAERLWADRGSDNSKAFLARLDKVDALP